MPCPVPNPTNNPALTPTINADLNQRAQSGPIHLLVQHVLVTAITFSTASKAATVPGCSALSNTLTPGREGCRATWLAKQVFVQYCRQLRHCCRAAHLIWFSSLYRALLRVRMYVQLGVHE